VDFEEDREEKARDRPAEIERRARKNRMNKWLKHAIHAIAGTLLAIVLLVSGSVIYVLILFSPSPPRVFVGESIRQFSPTNYEFHGIVANALRGPEIPADARNVFVYCSCTRDPGYWVAFSLPQESITPFIQELLGIPMSEFTNSITSIPQHFTLLPSVQQGPGKWDLNLMKNGKHMNTMFRYVGVDIDRHRIFICYQSM
jgi:hypothetical protein